MLQIVRVESANQIDEAKILFREYEKWLGIDLCFHGFEAELVNLPGKYAFPNGRLYLAYFEDALAGCVALRKLVDGICEMKRLFVHDDFRGKRVGVELIERVISDAREIGYSKLRLDTYPPKMGKAVKLYESHGFLQIPPYYENPHGDVLFMELDLSDHIPLPKLLP